MAAETVRNRKFGLSTRSRVEGKQGKINLASADINVGLGTTMKIKDGGGPQDNSGKKPKKNPEHGKFAAALEAVTSEIKELKEMVLNQTSQSSSRDPITTPR